jgi:hypothetical protein
LVQALCESGDAGTPLVLQEGIVKNAFEQLADKLLQ